MPTCSKTPRPIRPAASGSLSAIYAQSFCRSAMVAADQSYFETHAVAQDSSNCLVSSCVLLRPAAMSARPRRVADIMFNSSVISFREAFSGSLCKASITACLSVTDECYLGGRGCARIAESLQSRVRSMSARAGSSKIAETHFWQFEHATTKR
jgi:hypothetical protein